MTCHELMTEIGLILDDARTGILATVNEQGRPCCRWMTPAALPGRPGLLYTVTAPESAKVAHLELHAEVEWVLQTRNLNRILTLHGRACALDNPALKNEVLETLGRRLFMFWKTQHQPDRFVVLETAIESASLYLPMQDRTTHWAAEEGGR